MKLKNKVFSKLALVFLTSFILAFTSSSHSLAGLLQVDLQWENLPKGLGLASNKAVQGLDFVGDKAVSGLNTAASAYIDVLVHVSNNIAFADNVTKTEIYSANGNAVPEIALTAEEIRAKKSSFSVLVDNQQANIKNFVYYSQHDPRWKDYLIAGSDELEKYGCGPTALSMLVANLSRASFTPDRAAEWATQNGYYMKGSGSYHHIILKGAQAFNIDCVPYNKYSEAAIRSELEKGNVFAALVRPGVFSQASNHFILFLGLDEAGQVIIGEPNSHERTEKTWPLDALVKELQYRSNGGGPLWMVKLAK